ncbi:MAG: alpha/beta fold hydrolase [Saprospiraceae bacterium]|nr:alpha/beta fold hydrolase [Saprospiraceae bacterium]MBK9727221.1 alpha/beta fold hydrolase [Saprospiraceae bacterium]
MQTIILLHGALGSKEQMSPLANLLSIHFNVHILEFSGHGKSEDSENEFKIPQMAQELNDYIQFQQIDKPFIFGYSMGGYVALYHAFLFPDKTEKIITLATKFDWNLESATKEANQLNPDIMQTQIPAFVELLEIRHGSKWSNVVQKTARMMIELADSNLLNPNTLSTIKTTSLICLGDKDKMVTFIESEQTASALQNATLKILKDTPHPFERVKLDNLAFEIIEFCNS